MKSETAAMNALEETGQFTLTIPLEAHFMAQTFRQQHRSVAKGKQVYLNTLAVYAVKQYLDYFGVETCLDHSESWDPVGQALLDTAALAIQDHGQVECRPVSPGATVCYIPPEVWADRTGYVAVLLDAQLASATLHGFLQTTARSEVDLNHFQPLETIFDCLESSSLPGLSSVTALSQWLQGQITAGWESLETLLQQPQPAFSFRQGDASHLSAGQAAEAVRRGKLLNLESPIACGPLILVVAIAPTETSAFNIGVKVLPAGDTPHLPPSLEVSVLDEAHVVVMQAQARETETIELRFGGDAGDRFDIRLMLEDVCHTEAFVL